MLLQPLAEPVVGGPLHQRAHGHVAQLALGLAFELRLAQLHGDDGDEALADVLAEEVLLLLLEQALVPGVAVHAHREGLAEALLVHAALDRVDAVGEGVQAVGLEAGVPLEGDLDLAVVLLGGEPAHLGEQRLARGVEMADEVDDAALVVELDTWPSPSRRALAVRGPRRRRAQVGEHDAQTAVEVRHHLQPLDERAGGERRVLEDGGVGPEAHGGAGAAAGREAHDVEALVGLAAVAEGHRVALAVPVDLDLDAGGTAR